MADLLDYNVYLLDGRGRIQRRRPLLAASDECAVWVFSKLELAQPAELWRRGRRIAALGKDGEAQRF